MHVSFEFWHTKEKVDVRGCCVNIIGCAVSDPAPQANQNSVEFNRMGPVQPPPTVTDCDYQRKKITCDRTIRNSTNSEATYAYNQYVAHAQVSGIFISK